MRLFLAIGLGTLVVLASCRRHTTNAGNSGERPSLPETVPTSRIPLMVDQQMNETLLPDPDPWLQARLDMVNLQIQRRGIEAPRVLETLSRIPRHQFVPTDLRPVAYEDRPLPIGYGQTISQPYIVALMTELVRPQPTDRALEIGTGCGYQTAVLAELVDQVYSIEIVEPLAKQASRLLQQLGKLNVDVRAGDGYQGWLEQAPFQIIVVTAAPDHIPQPLLDQLAPKGRMVIPVGRNTQELLLIEKSATGHISQKNVTAVMFVPMTGTASEN
jgi:protein-L-isoaspartate(D-aspartate) O-methyltransferase